MLLLIPLGGLGVRFTNIGYTKPKPLINVLGKPIISWLLDTLDLSEITKVIIPYNNSLKKFRFEDFLKKQYPHINFYFIHLVENTLGASHTILKSLESLDYNNKDEPIICLDGDNFYMCNILSLWNKKNQIIVFEDTNSQPIYSYVKINNNEVLEIKEKIKISNYACSGGYAFDSWKNLLKYCKKAYNNKLLQKGELYTSGIINEMIKDNIKFNVSLIESSQVICLGTPLQVRLFCNNYPKFEALELKEKIHPKRFCFDLDNTLVTFPKITNDYRTVEPLIDNIEMVRYLKNFGHTIIIYTARRMKTCQGDQGKVMANIGKITFETLDKFNIPYDEIYFGKPQADYYIDDLGVNAFNNLEKELGFYSSSIKSRSFNLINSININIIKKSSDNLDGEIYYYNNIPSQVKDLFPVMVKYDEISFKWYDMEKIYGIPLSKLYLAEELSTELLEVIIKSVERLHKIKPTNNNDNNDNNNINIYGNYIKKIEERYLNFDYTTFKHSKQIFDELINYFYIYENKKQADIGMIHGDPVFTNILINQFGKIKLLDMRGKITNNLTIYGDIYYDYGKIYQSLTGYEEVLGNTSVNIYYKKNLINYFENRMGIKIMEKVKMIKKMLLFTLIPLHKGENLDAFYNLIFIK